MLLAAKMRRSAAYAVIFCVAAYLYYLAGQFQYDQQPGRIGPDAWPKIVLALLLATCAWQIVRALTSSGVAAGRDVAEEPTGLTEAEEDVPHLAWLAIATTVGYAFVLPYLGFFVATILYIALVTFVGRYRRPGPLFLTSVLAPLALIFIFMKIVYLSLPLGQGPFKALSLALLHLFGIH